MNVKSDDGLRVEGNKEVEEIQESNSTLLFPFLDIFVNGAGKNNLFMNLSQRSGAGMIKNIRIQ